MLPLICLFLLYNANMRPIPSGDSLPTVLGAMSLWLDGTLAVDRFQPFLGTQAHYFHWENGHLYGNYPRMQVAVASPLFWPILLVPNAGKLTPEALAVIGRILEKLAASAIAVLCTWLFYLIALRIAERSIAWWLAAAFAIATPVASTVAQALWSHTLALPFLMGAFLLGLMSRDHRHWAPLVAGSAVLGGVAFMIRPTAGLFFAGMGLAILLARRDWRQVLLFSAVGFLMIWLGINANPGVQGVPSDRSLDVAFGNPFWRGLAGVLLSPGRGLFVYSPVLLLSLPGAWLLWRGYRQEPRGVGFEILMVSTVLCGGIILITAKWYGWPGGYCFGPRLLTFTVPFLLLLTSPAWPRLKDPLSRRIAAGTLVAFSLFVEYVGVFHYPRGHWDFAYDQGSIPHGMFDWSDNPISRSFLAGPATEPYWIVWAYATGGESAARRVMAENGVMVY